MNVSELFGAPITTSMGPCGNPGSHSEGGWASPGDPPTQEAHIPIRLASCPKQGGYIIQELGGPGEARAEVWGLGVCKRFLSLRLPRGACYSGGSQRWPV